MENQQEKDEIWLEKYRPVTLEDVFGNSESVYKLKRIVESHNIPNLIIVGPPGTGKTSSVLCLAKMVLKEQWKQAFKELNASDERGIDVVRDDIKSFAMKKINLEPGKHKLILLDEADSLTEGAQQALRMIISDYSESTRFVLSCNDSTKLIDAIQSRCAILRFTKLTNEEIRDRILQIIQKENIQYDIQGLDMILFSAEGDMRQAINNLQACATGFGLVNKENVLRVCDIPNIDVIEKCIDYCVLGDFQQAQETLHPLWQEGFSAYDLVVTINRIIMNSKKLDKNIQYEYLHDISYLKLRILEGLPTFLQISGYLARCCKNGLQYQEQLKNQRR